MSEPSSPAIVTGLNALSARYDVILCDIWGVLHNGLSAHRPAGEALTRYRKGGGRVVLVSNAPRPGAVVRRHLDALGVPREAYDSIVTSGDITRMAIEERPGQIVHHIGPARDLPIFEGLDIGKGAIAQADFVVCSGLEDDDRETVEDYLPRLREMRARELLMICANPDLVVERGHEILPCAGALAAAYEELGGQVLWAGKPHAPIYETALARAAGPEGPPARARVLAIGDAIRTDIAGAEAFGIDSLLIVRGIHAAELELERDALDPQRVSAWAAGQRHRPGAVALFLAWE